MSCLFVTFGDGARNFRAASNLLGRQARASGWFDEVWAVDDIARYPEFHRAHQRVLKRETRGFGYWIWKPYLLLNAAQSGFDHVVYADAGCVLNIQERAKSRFLEYLQIADDRSLLAMGDGHSESQYTKRATWEHFGLIADQLVGGQSQSGILIMRSREAESLLAEWLHSCIVDDYRLVDDSPSDGPETPTFLDHRHDQSILSCLMKVNAISPIDDEAYFPGCWTTNGGHVPIWATRHRWGTPFPVTGLWRQSRFVIERQWSPAMDRLSGRSGSRT